SISQRDEGRKPLAGPLPGDYRTEIRRMPTRPFVGAGQPDRAGHEMIATEVHMTADDGVERTALGKSGEQLTEIEAGSACGDRGERAAVFERRLRFRVERIEMTRAAPEPDQQHRPCPRRFGGDRGRQRPETECRREAQTGPQKSPAAHPA